jgi:hypothetical protein
MWVELKHEPAVCAESPSPPLGEGCRGAADTWIEVGKRAGDADDGVKSRRLQRELQSIRRLEPESFKPQVLRPLAGESDATLRQVDPVARPQLASKRELDEEASVAAPDLQNRATDYARGNEIGLRTGPLK